MKTLSTEELTILAIFIVIFLETAIALMTLGFFTAHALFG